MDCRIEWNKLSLEEWSKRFMLIRRAPLLQSYDYACATYSRKGQKPKWGVIFIDGEEAGLVQMAEASTLFGLINAVILDMGPLWIDSYNLKEKNKAFYKEFNRLFPKRIGRKRRIIPNLEKSKSFHDIPDQKSYKEHGSSYETIWLDLTEEEEFLRKKLKQKWRNQLNKSEKSNLFTEIDVNGDTFQTFSDTYTFNFIEKGFQNIHPRDLTTFFRAFLKNNHAFLAYTTHNKEKIAHALILIHGSSATYQIGHVSQKGRDLCANHFLLWSIIKHLKNIGVKDFDLGGINAYDAKGIKHFKEGIGGEKITYKGIYS